MRLPNSTNGLPHVRLDPEPLRCWLIRKYHAQVDGPGANQGQAGYGAAGRAGLCRRTWARYRKAGVPLNSADQIAVELFGVHPVAIWGRAWFTAVDS